MQKVLAKVNKGKESKKRNFDDVILDAMDYRHRATGSGYHHIIIPSRRPPNDDVMYLNEITFNTKKDYLGTEIGAYKKVEAVATLGRIKQSKDRKFIAIEIVKDHLFGNEDYTTIEIVLFKAVLGSDSDKHHSLMKTKVTVNIENGV